MHNEQIHFISDSTAMRMKKRMTSGHKLSLQEKMELINASESELANIYINSKAKIPTTLQGFFAKTKSLCWN
jgi:hypothetical protein